MTKKHFEAIAAAIKEARSVSVWNRKPNAPADPNEKLDYKVKFAPVYSKCQREASCVLTGCCYDEDILEPIYNFLKKPDANTDLEDLIKSCLYSWIKAMADEYEYQCSDKGIAEDCEANDYKFLENGKMF